MQFAPPRFQKFRPFVSPSLDDYLKRYWAVVFTIGSRPLETAQLRQYLSWYCTRGKFVELDHHIFAHRLRQSIVEQSGVTDLPVLFVRQKCVGTLADVRELEQKKLLKDVLQFGFRWQTGGGSGEVGRPVLPSAYDDTELFRARYRGPPVAKPIVRLPTFHPCCGANQEK